MKLALLSIIILCLWITGCSDDKQFSMSYAPPADFIINTLTNAQNHKNDGKPAMTQIYDNLAGISEESAALKIAEIEKSAKSGDAYDQCILACFYFISNERTINYIKPNDIEAMRWLQESANGGEEKAQHLLGLFYLDGVYGLERDVNKGRGLLQKAAKKGVAGAYRTLKVSGGLGSSGSLDDLENHIPVSGKSTLLIPYETLVARFTLEIKEMPLNDFHSILAHKIAKADKAKLYDSYENANYIYKTAIYLMVAWDLRKDDLPEIKTDNGDLLNYPGKTMSLIIYAEQHRHETAKELREIYLEKLAK